MSSFNCPICDTPIIDTPQGFITGCKHWPMEKEKEHELDD